MWAWLRKLVASTEATATASNAVNDASRSSEIKELNAFYCEVAMMKLNSQFEKIDSIDTRTTSYFIIGSTILPIVAGFVSSDQSPIADCVLAKIALFLGLGFYVLLASFYVWSFLYAGWDSRPEMEQWKNMTTQFTVEDVQRWLGDACVDAYTANEPAIERKANKSALALWCLAGEVVCLSIAVLAPLW